MPCPDVFVQDVLYSVQRKGLHFDGYLDATRPAVLDADHCLTVNYETFLFADAANRERFLADVREHCGLLTDPVSKRRFRPGPDAPRAEHAGHSWFFESRANRDMFLRAPDDYRLPGYTM
ncbi:MAG: hypothetical protein DHS20C15_05160 [Planctomycetota bacterium]|nr:MAG: hypothetical protein DHS20C15_05160 [Planctomycetota bacterium]